MECTLIGLNINSQVYMEGIAEVLCKIKDNEPAYIVNNTPYVKLASYINGLYEWEIISSIEYTEEQYIKIMFSKNTVDMETLLSLGDLINYPIIQEVGLHTVDMVDQDGEYCGSFEKLAVTYRKG